MNELERLRQDIWDKGILNNTLDYIDKVKDMEDNGLYVYHVIDGEYLIGELDEVRMLSFLFVSEDDLGDEEEHFWENFNSGYAMANVMNITWDIEEMGTIGIVMDAADGSLIRTA